MLVAAPDATLPWLKRFDFDGDGRNDHVEAEYTGGGHCCYRFKVRLTTGREVSLPFSMDGGYVGGDLLSNPRRFAIRAGSDGVAEIWMEIETYNGEPQLLDPQWTRRWGFSSHRVIIGFRGGEVTVRFTPYWSCVASIVPSTAPPRHATRGAPAARRVPPRRRDWG